jgi:hypothetical protein
MWLQLDEMIMAWRGKKGNGGISYLSFVEWKPIPLGTELKCVCEGTFGIAMFLEVQTGKITMAPKKWVRQYKATTACTVRLLDKMGMKERQGDNKNGVCTWTRGSHPWRLLWLFVKSWEWNLITAHKYFPIEAMRFTLSEMRRGEHIVF